VRAIQIDKDTGLVSIVPIATLVGAGTKEEKLWKLEALFREKNLRENISSLKRKIFRGRIRPIFQKYLCF
jgi:hypothetical protein